MAATDFLPKALTDRYEVYNHRHAAEILAAAFPSLLNELSEALSKFSLTTADIDWRVAMRA